MVFIGLVVFIDLEEKNFVKWWIDDERCIFYIVCGMMYDNKLRLMVLGYLSKLGDLKIWINLKIIKYYGKR